MNSIDIDGVSTRSGNRPLPPSLSPGANSVTSPAASTSTTEEVPIHVTRRRTNSIVRRPRHLDSPSPSPPPPSSPVASHSMATTSASPSDAIMSTHRQPSTFVPSTLSTSKKLSLLHSASASLQQQAGSSPLLPPPPLHVTLGAPRASSSSHASSHSRPPKPISIPTAFSSASSAVGPDAYDFTTTDRRHPREYVPYEIGFPTKAMEDKVRNEDKEDRLLMATCAVLLAHENRALCPKEVAEVMEERGWLRNAGTTPFAHISTCIRSHLRRASTASPPYLPILRQYDLSGALTITDVRAVGLRAEERPAVKRGTLWFLEERVFGPGVGAEDPFVRCRREAGLEPEELSLQKAPLFVLPPPVTFGLPVPPPKPNQEQHEEEDESGMGRGKRKRRASSAAMAALSTDPPTSAFLSSAMSTSLPTSLIASHPPHRRAHSFGTASSSGGMNKTLKLKLRLTSLAEVDSFDDSEDGAGSDVQTRRKTKKKARRAASEGTSRSDSAELGGCGVGEMDDLDDVGNSVHAFSSASSSALLQQSLLAASAPSNQHSRFSSPSPTSTVVSPGSLQLASNSRPNPHHNLSVSAPPLGVGLFSAFTSSSTVTSPDQNAMEIDEGAPEEDSADDEDDFHEAMLRGDDFDFEWGSETYAGTAPVSSTAGNAVGGTKSVSFGDWSADRLEEREDDAESTPATTPRSPPAGNREDEEMGTTGAQLQEPTSVVLEEPPFKMGMEATLCEAYHKREEGEIESEEGQQSEEEDEVVVKEEDQTEFLGDRALSTDSLSSLVDAVPNPEDEDNSADDAEMVAPVEAISVPPPSPLSLEHPLLCHSRVFSPDYDFVGYEDEEHGDRTQYRSKSAAAYDRELAESADDEDEDDDIVTVKIEDEGSVGPETVPSSRQSSVYPLESFTRRLMEEQHLSSSSSSCSSSDSGDMYDPSVISSSLLASGLPLPQVAPSPPADWGMHLDLDDLDLELGSGVDLLGPESVGLEELDLAWGGPAEQGEDETDEEWRTRQQGRAVARGLAAGPTFMTGAQAVERLQSLTSATRPRSVASPSPRPPTSSLAPAPEPSISSTTKSPRLASPPAKPGVPSASVIVYPTVPLHPTVTATIVQRGVAVFATNVIDRASGSGTPLIRRIDTDYINGSVLLQGALNHAEEREAILAEFSETFKVASGGSGVEGTWIPLPAARVLVARYSSYLSQLNTFLDEDLGMRFPDPIPTMRTALRNSLASSSPRAVAFGFPVFADTHSDEGRSLSPAVAIPSTSSASLSISPPAIVNKSSPTGKGRPGRASTTKRSDSVDADEDEASSTKIRRKTRRRSSAATVTK